METLEKQLKSKVNDLCMWHNMACDINSTTFNSVREDSVKHPLYKCAYDCNGSKSSCDRYVCLDLPKKLNNNYEK